MPLPFHPGPRFLLLSAMCAAALTATAAAPTPAPWENKVWRQASELLVNEALDQLPSTRAAGSAAERRQLDFTRAVLLLNAQPKLPGNIDGARTLLEGVRQTQADDDLGLDALYYLARIAQFHADPADPAKAAALYTGLIGRAPAHPLAQEAVAKLAALRLFEDVSPEERHARLAGFEAAAAGLALPGARRDLHFVLAEARLRLDDDRAATLDHLLAAEDAGILRQQLAADTMVRIAVLARELGRRDVAAAHYRKFLATFQRDSRAYMLAEQLRTMEAEAPAPAVAPTPP